MNLCIQTIKKIFSKIYVNLNQLIFFLLQQSVMQCMEKIHEVVNTTPPTNKSSSPKFGTPKKSSKMKPGEEEDEDSTPTKVLDVAKQN